MHRRRHRAERFLVRRADGTVRESYTRAELLGLIDLLRRGNAAKRRDPRRLRFSSRYVRYRLQAAVALLGAAHLDGRRPTWAALSRLTLLDLPRLTLPRGLWRDLCGYLAMRANTQADTCSQSPLLCGIRGRSWLYSHLRRGLRRAVASPREDYRDLSALVLSNTELDLPRITCWEYHYSGCRREGLGWSWDDLLERLSPLYPGHPPILRGQRQHPRRPLRRPYAQV